MKQKKDAGFVRFNRFIFSGLLVLWGVIIVCYGFFNPDFGDYAKDDFENELMGQAYFARLNHNYKAEIKLYQRILEKIPECKAELSFKMGKASYEDEKYFTSVKYYKRALDAGCIDSVKVFFHLALTLQKLNKYYMAKKYYLLLVQHQQYGRQAYFNLGNISFFEMKEEDKALEYYENAIETQSIQNAYKKMLLRELQLYSSRKDSAIQQFLLTELKSENYKKDFTSYDLKEFYIVKPEKSQAIIHNYLGIIRANKNEKV